MVVRGIAGKYRGEAIALFLGLESGAMSHSLSDTIGSAWKRYQKGKQLDPSKKRREKPDLGAREQSAIALVIN